MPNAPTTTRPANFAFSRRNPAKEWPVTVDVGARVGELAPKALAAAIEAAVRARLSRLRERES